MEQTVPSPLAIGMIAICTRCKATLERRAGSDLLGAIALAVTSFLLIIPAVFLPIMTINFQGIDHQDWLISNALAYWTQGYHLVGILVGIVSVATPLFWLIGLLAVLFMTEFGGICSWTGRLFRWVTTLRPWAMSDVMLVGGFVAYTRLHSYAEVTITPGGWCFIGSALATLAVDPLLDERRIWSRLGDEATSAPEEGQFGCLVCDRRSSPNEEGQPCPRCGKTLHRRRPFSLMRSASLVAAGYMLYLPANLFPVMTIVRFGRREPNTITSGIVELFRYGLWPLGVIVFLASLAIPIFKLSGLTWCLIATRMGSSAQVATRTKLYRVIDWVGRWSNIDVFMIAILTALMQFGQLANVQPEPGIFAFAAVVVLTMLATESFDPRLMWDAAVPSR